jgi:hypothetical protein
MQRQALSHLHSKNVDAGNRLREFVEDNEIRTLNVAGSRASKEPGVAQLVGEALEAAFGNGAGPQ